MCFLHSCVSLPLPSNLPAVCVKLRVFKSCDTHWRGGGEEKIKKKFRLGFLAPDKHRHRLVLFCFYHFQTSRITWGFLFKKKNLFFYVTRYWWWTFIVQSLTLKIKKKIVKLCHVFFLKMMKKTIVWFRKWRRSRSNVRVDRWFFLSLRRWWLERLFRTFFRFK